MSGKCSLLTVPINLDCEKTGMVFKFENLRVFRSAATLSNRIDRLVDKFPKKELFSLGSQIKRSADSVVLNIAEGCTGQTTGDFRRFLGIALRSAIEVVACLYLAFTRNYFSEQEYKSLYEEYEVLVKMITRLR